VATGGSARFSLTNRDTNRATVVGLRPDDRIGWCYEHKAPVGACAELLRFRSEPVPGLVGQLLHCTDDSDLDGSIDASPAQRSSRENGTRRCVGREIQSFYRATSRGDP
jgi:hypothetical protein